MINIDNLINAIGFEFVPVLNKCPLEVAHSADTLFNAVVKYGESMIGHGVDAPRDKFGPIPTFVTKCSDVHLLVNVNP